MHYRRARRTNSAAQFSDPSPSPESSMRSASHAAMASFPTLFRPPGATQDSESCAAQNKVKSRRYAVGQKTIWSTQADPDVLAFAEATRESMAATVIPENQRAFIRRNFGLRALYGDWVLPDLERRVDAGTLRSATIQKDLQALSRWEKFSPRPDGWPPDRYWPGVPLEYITPRYLEDFLTRLYAECPPGTAKSTWSHLRNILNAAVKVRAIDMSPKPEHIPDPDDGPVRVYREEEIEAVYRSLQEHIELQVSFVLAINAGPRPVDLYLLRWSDFDLTNSKPSFAFSSRKTGKRQSVPLAPITIAHLRRLPSLNQDDYLFPRCSSPRSKDPEKSTAARARRERMQVCLRRANVEIDKPMQAARATCNTRLERHQTGAGVFVLGHGLSLNSRHYHEPSDMVFDAVTTVPQPACFSEF